MYELMRHDLAGCCMEIKDINALEIRMIWSRKKMLWIFQTFTWKHIKCQFSFMSYLSSASVDSSRHA